MEITNNVRVYKVVFVCWEGLESRERERRESREKEGKKEKKNTQKLVVINRELLSWFNHTHWFRKELPLSSSWLNEGKQESEEGSGILSVI